MAGFRYPLDILSRRDEGWPHSTGCPFSGLRDAVDRINPMNLIRLEPAEGHESAIQNPISLLPVPFGKGGFLMRFARLVLSVAYLGAFLGLASAACAAEAPKLTVYTYSSFNT